MSQEKKLEGCIRAHLKPGQVELIMGEIEECIGDFRPKMLQNNQLFEF